MRLQTKTSVARACPGAASRPTSGRLMRLAPGREAARRREGPALRSPFQARAAQEVEPAPESSTPSAGSQSSQEDEAEAHSQTSIHPLDRLKAALSSDVDAASMAGALSDLEGELARLQLHAAEAEARAAALEATAATAKDQLLRLNADFENVRRRTNEEKLQLTDRVRGDVVTSLLPVVDNFELARTQVKVGNEGEEKIHNSYQALYKQFAEFLRSIGVETVETVGTPFDPNFHEAIMKEANSEVADNTVLMEFRKGFKIGDTLLRPAMVKVSVNEFPPQASSEE